MFAKSIHFVLSAHLALACVSLSTNLNPTLAEDRYFCGGVDGDWDDVNNWKGNSACTAAADAIPTLNDKVIILSGKTCNVNIANAEADNLQVESTGVLNIDAGSAGNNRILSVDGTNFATSSINGVINLNGQYSTLRFTITDQTLTGSGKIIGLHDNATIDFSETVLTNDIIIEGNLKIMAATNDDHFRNFGTVNANRNGILLFDANLSITDDGSATWKISQVANGSATLRLNHLYQDFTGAAILVGLIEVYGGHLDIQSNVDLRDTYNKLIVYNGKVTTDSISTGYFSNDGVDSGCSF